MNNEQHTIQFNEEELEIIRHSQSIELLIKQLKKKLEIGRTEKARKDANSLIQKLNELTIGRYEQIRCSSNKFINKEKVI